jgi:hypothetical protein
MQKMHLVAFLALSLNILNTSAAHAFDTTVAEGDSAALVPQAALATLNEGFTSVSGLAAAGWVFQNNSNPGPLSTADWAQGNTSVSNYAAQAGAGNSFAEVTFASTGGDSITLAGGTVSNWLITPELDFSQGGTFSFYARTFGGNSRYEFLEVRSSSAGASSNVGTLATDVGVFTNVIGTVGALTGPVPGLPFASWTQSTFNVAATGAGGSGRLAFRYFGPDGGQSGTTNQYLTIDTASFTPAPEPAVSSLAGFAALGLASYFKGKRKRTVV